MIAVTTSGPLFEGTLDVRRGQRVGMERATERAAEIAREHLRRSTRYSTAKYGHAAESVRTKIVPVAGAPDQQIGSAFIGGQSAFLAPWLEFGVKPHDIPGAKSRFRTRIRSVRSGHGMRRSIERLMLLAYSAGGPVRFRTYTREKPFKHRGTRATHWASQSQAQINAEAPAIFEQAMAEALKA